MNSSSSIEHSQYRIEGEKETNLVTVFYNHTIWINVITIITIKRKLLIWSPGQTLFQLNEKPVIMLRILDSSNAILSSWRSHWNFFSPPLRESNKSIPPFLHCTVVNSLKSVTELQVCLVAPQSCNSQWINQRRKLENLDLGSWTVSPSFESIARLIKWNSTQIGNSSLTLYSLAVNLAENFSWREILAGNVWLNIKLFSNVQFLIILISDFEPETTWRSSFSLACLLLWL